jgi:hypothetical protein
LAYRLKVSGIEVHICDEVNSAVEYFATGDRIELLAVYTAYYQLAGEK